MGGGVGMSSQTGEGSTFRFTLRLAALPPAPPVALETPMQPPLAGLNAKVLLAEDNPVNQLVLGRMLELLGCSVDVVGDGKAACEAAASRRYDLVLMDLHMPLMDGFEATACIRTRPENASRAAPIVALTAAVLPQDRERCAGAGMNDFIRKPVTLARLRSCIAAQLAPGVRN